MHVRGERLAQAWREQNLESGATAHQVATVAAAGSADLGHWELLRARQWLAVPACSLHEFPQNAATTVLANGLEGGECGTGKQ